MKEAETRTLPGEFQLIRDYFVPLQSPAFAGVVLGIGDDAAVLAVPRTQQLLTTVDTLVEGIHFTASDDPFRLGQKALLVNLSDIAAMGGKPCWYLLSLSLPSDTSLTWIEAFVAGLREASERFGVTVVGGNTTGSKAGRTIGITLFGLVGQGRALTRAGSEPGDRILVTGTIGDAALALAMRQGGLSLAGGEDLAFLQQRLDRPDPRVGLGLAIADAMVVHGMMDVSDGLVADLGHLCAASGVGAQLYAEKVPFSPAARRQLEQNPDLLPLLLTGGEDYELLCTASPGALALLATLADEAGVPLTEIGEITASGDVVVTLENKPLPLDRGGWAHF
ncbi:MAG: thiamine-phosphate kinase [Magnetococcales bacterium]|nr:thiamine-phosphate kinase [Magnetococcales bacterium]